MFPVYTPPSHESHERTSKRIKCCQISIRILSATVCRSYSIHGSHSKTPPLPIETVTQFMKCIQPACVNNASQCSNKSNGRGFLGPHFKDTVHQCREAMSMNYPHSKCSQKAELASSYLFLLTHPMEWEGSHFM